MPLLFLTSFVTNVAFVEGVKCPFLYRFECLEFGAHLDTNPDIKQIIVRVKIRGTLLFFFWMLRDALQRTEIQNKNNNTKED